MKYRLKNRELQRKLDELSAGDFTNSLQEACSSNVKCAGYVISFGPIYRRIQNGERPKFSAHIHKDEIEQYDEECSYSSWNKYPEVEPPEDVWMRCVMTDIHHNNRIVRVGAKFSAGAWRDHEGVAFEPRFRVDKFKSWDEEDEE